MNGMISLTISLMFFALEFPQICVSSTFSLWQMKFAALAFSVVVDTPYLLESLGLTIAAYSLGPRTDLSSSSSLIDSIVLMTLLTPDRL